MILLGRRDLGQEKHLSQEAGTISSVRLFEAALAFSSCAKGCWTLKASGYSRPKEMTFSPVSELRLI